MNRTLQEELLHKNYLVLDVKGVADDETINDVHLGAIINSFASLGYILDQESLAKLKKLPLDVLANFYNTSYRILNHAVGNDVKHKVFYANFPFLENMPVVEMYLRAILHYATASSEDYGFVNQDLEEFKRKRDRIVQKGQVLTIIDQKMADKILIEMANNLYEQKTSIPASLDGFCLEAKRAYRSLINPKVIPFKENMVLYLNIILKLNNDNIAKTLTLENLSFVQTATDVLRVYTVISAHKTTLSGYIKFLSIPRCSRKILLGMLDEMAQNNPNLIDDLARHEFHFKKAFELLHVGEYKDKFPHIYQLANDLRSGNYQTYYSKLVSAANNQDELLKLLTLRPGEFARRLDYVLRNKNYDYHKTLDSFAKVADKVATTVLLQLYNYYLNRNILQRRIFSFQTGMTAKVFATDELTDYLDEDIINDVSNLLIKTLMELYGNYPVIEDVYVSKNLVNYALPTNNRNASRANKTLTPGSKIKLSSNGKDYLRLFTHWQNIPVIEKKDPDDGRVDIDLSVELYDDEFNFVSDISWHHLEGGKDFDSYHSGDLITAPEPDGASEFIDFAYKKAAKFARYALIVNSVYTCQEFAEIPDCFSGVMFLNEKDRQKEIFQPKNVQYKYYLTQKGSNQNLALAVDLKTLELIWIDSPLLVHDSYVVAADNVMLSYTLEKTLQKKINMYDFIMLHHKHLKFVDDISKAKFIISDDDKADLSPFDGEIIASKWL